MNLKLWLLAFVALLAGISVSVYRNSAPQPEAESFTSLTQMALPDLAGKRQPFAQWKGKLLLVNFWATWCPPCRNEIPVFMSVRNKYLADGFEIVGISIDSAEKVLGFRDELVIDYPLLDGEEKGIPMMTRLGNAIGALPYSVLFDRKGNPVFYKSGEFSHDELEALLKKHL